MKTGRSLQELAAEIARQVESKRDFIADTRKLSMLSYPDEGMKLIVEGQGEFAVNQLAHQQIANRVGIPQKYYDRMLAEAPQLLTLNVRHWFNMVPERRLVRTLDGRARAFLSNRYRPLDNFDLAEVALEHLSQPGFRVESCDLTDKHLYIKAVTDRITAEVVKGDVVQSGIVVSNSEVGCGSVKVEPLVFILACKNGAIVNDVGLHKYHVGRGMGGGGQDGEETEGAAEFFRDETRQADDKAFWMKVRDIIAAAFDEVKFKGIVRKFVESREVKIEADPVKLLEGFAKQYDLNDDERGSVLRHLIEGKDLSGYGMSSAITRASQDVKDYERATDLERLGGAVIELAKLDWEKMAAA